MAPFRAVFLTTYGGEKMPEVIPAKSAKAKVKVTMKMCPKCNTSKPITDFYVNRDWEEQLGHDLWCKDCFAKCQTKDDVREYFWNNNKEFTDTMWDTAIAKAERQAATNQTFQRMSDDRREKILSKLACAQIPSLMIRAKFVNNAPDGNIISYDEAKRQGKIIAEVDEDIRSYSPEFNGDFKKRELEYLEDYYRGLENDFDLSDTNLRDIARKLAKASLQADKVQNDFSLGRCSMSDVKDALSQVDLLSKTGNFAACKKRPGDNTGLSSWSEITLKLETTGHPCTRKIEWEPDDVDRTIAEFRYLAESLSLDSL